MQANYNWLQKHKGRKVFFMGTENQQDPTSTKVHKNVIHVSKDVVNLLL